MKIFFVFPSIKLDMTVNHGVASLCGVIRDRGHEVDIYHCDRIDRDDILGRFREKEYSLCLVSSVTNQWPYSLEIIRAVREVSDIPVIAGGHHVTNSPEALEENPEIDAICIGEGDIALGEILDSMARGGDYSSINNLHVRRRGSGEIIKNEIGKLIEDLDTLPFPDYSAFSPKSIANYPALMFSRGCPYNCTYCCNNSLRKLYRGKGKYIRSKSVARALEEVSSFIREFKPQALNFDDDTFIKNREWLYSFLDGYGKLTDIPFNCNTRPETLDEELCLRLSNAHCRSVSIGIESGSERLREQILKRHMSNESIKRSFALLRQAGIKTSSFNMVGIPDETYRDYMETVALNREINPDFMQISIFYPYKGSGLGDLAQEKGYLDENAGFSHSYFSGSILKMKQFPKWKIRFAYLFFHFNVYRKTSLAKAVYYFLRYNLLKNAVIKKILKRLLGR